MRNYNLSIAHLVINNSGTAGVQEKYCRNGYWYKIDKVQGEGLSEHLVSLLLQHSSLPKSAYTYYEWCKINGKYGCRSKSFTTGNESYISFDTMYKRLYSGSLENYLYSLRDSSERYKALLVLARNYANLNMEAYFRVCFCLDLLIENSDRHLKNIGVIYNSKTNSYRIPPIFDNGLSLGTGSMGDVTVAARTISGSFADQVVVSCGYPIRSPFAIGYKSLEKDLVKYVRYPQVRALQRNLEKYRPIFMKGA